MDMQFFSPIFGLVTSRDKVTENSGTFFMYYLILKQMNGLQITSFDYGIFLQKMQNAKVADGLYLRTAHHTKRTVSHDEVTSFIVTSSILQTSHGPAVAEYLKHSNGNYPATGASKYYNPSNYFAWYKISGVKGHTFFPSLIYVASLIITCNGPKSESSSKLLYLAELYTLRKQYPRLWKYYTGKMEKQYGPFWVKELFDIYFNNPVYGGENADYPLLVLSRQFDLDFNK